MIEENKEIVVIDETTIKSKIYYLRNQKVMLKFMGILPKELMNKLKEITKNLMIILCFN